MENVSLYNIKNRFFDLFEKAENEELTQEEYQEQGTELAKMLQNKSSNIIGYQRNIEETLNSIKSEIDRLTAIKKAIEQKNNKFTEYVKNNMIELGIDKIETPLGNLVIAKNPASVEIYDEELIPNDYIQEKITRAPDKTKKKEALKNGENVKGARLITDKKSLRIK